METKIVLRVTRSQQMAVLDLIMESLRCPAKRHHSRFFIDCSHNPTIETKAGDLLEVFGSTREVEQVPVVPKDLHYVSCHMCGGHALLAFDKTLRLYFAICEGCKHLTRLGDVKDDTCEGHTPHV